MSMFEEFISFLADCFLR